MNLEQLSKDLKEIRDMYFVDQFDDANDRLDFIINEIQIAMEGQGQLERLLCGERIPANESKNILVEGQNKLFEIYEKYGKKELGPLIYRHKLGDIGLFKDMFGEINDLVGRIFLDT